MLQYKNRYINVKGFSCNLHVFMQQRVGGKQGKVLEEGRGKRSAGKKEVGKPFFTCIEKQLNSFLSNGSPQKTVHVTKGNSFHFYPLMLR